MRRAHKAMKSWVSQNKQSPYKREYHDTHPHHPIIKVDSHQLDKNGKPTGRHPTLTPNRALVKMNNLVDKIIEKNFLLKFRGLNYTKSIPPDWRFDTHGLRFTFFVGGNAVNKSVVNQWWRMENDERRNKLAQRS